VRTPLTRYTTRIQWLSEVMFSRRNGKGLALEYPSFGKSRGAVAGAEKHDRDKVSTEAMAKPKESLIRKIKKIGVKELVRSGCGERILKKTCRRALMRTDTLNEYERKVEDYAL
jgi:hypothetical protein